jgi:MYXO-CTERM domain-containing protein
MNVKRPLSALAVLAASTLLSPAQADACSCLFECKNTIITGSTLASGAEGFYWFLAGPGVQPDDIPDGVITLEKQGAEGYEAVAWEITASHPTGSYHLIKPEAGFEVGATYRFTADLSGWDPGCSFEIESGRIEETVTVETEIVEIVPTSKLTATVSEQDRGQIDFESDAVCSERFDASYRNVTIELPADLEPLADSLFYDVTVDGESYYRQATSCVTDLPLPNELDQGGRTAMLAALCETAPDYAGAGALEPGEYEVVVRARLPESEVFNWKSDPFTVTLDCTGEPDPGPGPGPGPGPDPDAGDGGDDQDAGDGAGEPDAGSGSGGGGGESEGEGCAQASPGAPAGAPGALALGLLGLLGLGRRRRAR